MVVVGGDRGIGTKVSIRVLRVHLGASTSTKWHLFWDGRVKGVIDIYGHIAQTAYERYTR